VKEITSDIWCAAKGSVLVVTTNGDVRKDGACVMGRGLALQASRRFPDLPFVLGNRIVVNGNHAHHLGSWHEYEIVSLPVKHHWRDPANLLLIERSIKELQELALSGLVFLTRPGCQNGRLLWKDVRPLLLGLSDQYIICDWAAA